MKKILILASNPRKDLNLDDEIRLLRKVVDQSRDRDQFEIVSEPGVRVEDLQGLLLRHQPQIVHFCGHGGGEQGLIFKIDGGGEQCVGAAALAGMFRLNPISSHVQCVLLNACYSEQQADAIVSSIDYVVGMSHEIQDDAAIAFSKGFYLALGYGCSIDDAFEFGKNAIQLEISGSSKTRSAGSETQRKLAVLDAVNNTSIPEHLKPILRKKATLTLAASLNPLAQATKVEIQLAIDKTLEPDDQETDTNVDHYRKQVREYLINGQLEDYQKDLLDALRDELGLSLEKAQQIQEEEFAPILQARQAYKTRLTALIKYYPFKPAINRELQKFQVQRNLTDEEVNEISQPILAQAEIIYQAQQAEAQRQRAEQAERVQQEAFERAQRQRAEQAERVQQEALERQQQEEAERNRAQAERRERIKTTLGVTLPEFEFDVIKVDQHGKENSRTRKSAEFFPEDLGNQILLEMVRIPGGTFLMGAPKAETDSIDDERPQHQVNVPEFYLGKYPVTQAQWRCGASLPQIDRKLDPDPSGFKGDNLLPVEQVSWLDAIEFCARLSRHTKRAYRLPSEAEWEYACRAETTTPFHFGETIDPQIANYNGNYTYGIGQTGTYRQKTTPVGSFKVANNYGLFDMHGNVWEWCQDHWHSSYQEAPGDGSAWIDAESSDRVLRGGSWINLPANCRAAYRFCISPANRNYIVGFRVVCAVFPGFF